MVCPRKDDFAEDGSAEGSHLENQVTDDDLESHGSDIGSSGESNAASQRRSSDREIGLTERLRDFFRGEEDVDSLINLGRSDGDVILQWLQALQLHVTGACRADERLKPLFKFNISNGAAEERLLSHLNQHFDASEVGMLARCFCVPLVSIRVGKVIKNGNLICPTTKRGYLNLSLLPSSDLRILFVGDDACSEKLSVLSNDAECASVIIDHISADSSGRSFFVKTPGGQISYFWCSEKSKLLGDDLLAKMKDLLRKKPSVSQLTGISQSQLNWFANHLCDYLTNSGNALPSIPLAPPATSSSNPLGRHHHRIQSALPCSSKISHFRATTSQHGKSHPSHYQAGLCPRPNTFKDYLPRNSLPNRNQGREKFKSQSDGLCSVLAADIASLTSTSIVSENQTAVQPETGKVSEDHSSCSWPLTFTLSLPFTPPSSINQLPFHAPQTKISMSSDSLISPYYCLCPPSPLLPRHIETPHSLQRSSEALTMSPISSLLSATRSSSSLPNPILGLAGVPLPDLPTFLSHPLSSISLPMSVPSSQQIPISSSFFSEPIVHIPVIDVCSSGQGYLVSAGPTISAGIAPLLPNLVNPLVPEAESAVEKSARETLRLLIDSTRSNNRLMEMPASEKSLLCTPMVFGSRGLYSGTLDVASANGSRGLYSGTLDVTSMNGISGVGFASAPRIGVEGDDDERHNLKGDDECSGKKPQDTISKSED